AAMAWRVTAMVGRCATVILALPERWRRDRSADRAAASSPAGGVGVLRRGKAAAADLFGIVACGGAELAVALDEFRGELGEQAEHVVGHQDLPVAGRRRADPDRRRRHPRGQFAP